MIQDNQLMLADAQVVTATANGANVIDNGGNRNIGAGEPLKVVAKLVDGSTACPTTFTMTLKGADDVGITTNVVTLATATPTLTTGATQLVHFGLAAVAPKRYWRCDFTVAGGTAPSVTSSVFITKDEQTSAGI